MSAGDYIEKLNFNSTVVQLEETEDKRGGRRPDFNSTVVQLEALSLAQQ